MSMKGSDFGPRDYSDGMTKQAFKDSCDINKILKKAQKQGSLAHLQKYDKAVYGVFENYDLLEAHQNLTRANEIFADLPSEVRKEFNNDALGFVKFAADPANNGRLGEILPAVAEPGAYFPDPVRRAEPPAEPVTPTPPVDPGPPPDVGGGD